MKEVTWIYESYRPETRVKLPVVYLTSKPEDKTMTETQTEERKQPVPSLPLADVLAGAELAVVGPDVMQERRTRPGRSARDRSAEQKLFDNLVAQAYSKWTAAGKPKAFKDSPGGSVKVRNEELVILTVQRAIRRSGQYQDMSIRFGLTEPDEDGNVVILFKASDPREAGEEASADESDDESGDEE